MIPLKACRMCLSVNERMFVITDTPLQDFYEKITCKSFQSNDGKPVMACYICRRLLEKSYRFQQRTIATEEFLQKILDSELELTEASIKMNNSYFKPLLTKTTPDCWTMEEPTPASDKLIEVTIKQEMDENEMEKDIALDSGTYSTSGGALSQESKCKNAKNKTDCLEPSESMKYELVEVKIEREMDETIGSNDEFQDPPGWGDKNDSIQGSGIKQTSLRDGTASELEKPNETAQSEPKNIDYDNPTEYMQLKLSDTGQKLYCCSVCQKVFYCRSALVTHIRIHTGYKPYRCSFCTKSFKQKAHLNFHLTAHTGNRNYICKVCNKSFYLRGDLMRHIPSHKEYSCEFCDLTFNLKGDLARHVVCHTGRKAYSCDRCDKSFYERNLLVTHKRIHSGEKQFSCKVCGKAFNKKSNLVRHTTVHSGDRSHNCTYCDKSFSGKGSLNAHLRIHTGEKPYNCQLCDKSFAQVGHLTTHMAVHTGKRSYCCDHCTKSFSHKKRLEKHLEMHGEERPYHCEVCQKVYYRRGPFLRHMTTHANVSNAKVS